METKNQKVIKEQIANAKERTRLADAVEPRAKAAYYDRSNNRIVVELSNGAEFRFSPLAVQELVGRKPQEIAQIEISSSGRTLRWKELNADLSLPGLMMGIFGSRMWMAQLGRIGGQTTSEGKAAAARLNGAKGGRPSRPVTKVAVRKLAAVRASKRVSGSTLSPRKRFTKSAKAVGRQASSVRVRRPTGKKK